MMQVESQRGGKEDENRFRDSLYKTGTEGTGAFSSRNDYLDRAGDDFRTCEPETGSQRVSELQLVASHTLLDQHNR